MSGGEKTAVLRGGGCTDSILRTSKLSRKGCEKERKPDFINERAMRPEER